MADLLDSGSLRSTGYLALAVVAAILAWRERTCVDRERYDLWPRYWMWTALVLLTVGIAHAGHLGDLVAELGREQARQAGWYETRRGLQGLAVLGVSFGWCVTVLVAIWRVPPRRRRYLPSAIVVFTMLAFVAVRAVSLHHVDELLYNRGMRSVRFVAWIELTLLALAAATMAVRWNPTPTAMRRNEDRADGRSRHTASNGRPG